MRVGWNPPIIAKNGDFCATNLTKKLLVNTQPHNLYLQVHRQSVIDIGRRTQFLKRMVQFSDWSGLEIRLVYYPPYHSKYNLIERCWSALEKKWNGVLLNCLEVVLQCALRMTWKGQHPIVKRLEGEYPDGIRVAAKEMKEYEARLERSATLPKYDITIKPKTAEQQVK